MDSPQLHQSADLLLMIRPASFRKNEETAVNNGYQQDADSGEDTVELARREFDGLVDALRAEDIDVAVYEDDAEDDSGDSHL